MFVIAYKEYQYYNSLNPSWYCRISFVDTEKSKKRDWYTDE